MSMTEYVGVRLPKDELKVIEEKARDEIKDKSSALRELLEEGIRQYKIERAVSQYSAKKVSLGRAARIAGVSIGEMMDILANRGIPSHLTVKEYKDGLKNIEKVFKIKLS